MNRRRTLFITATAALAVAIVTVLPGPARDTAAPVTFPQRPLPGAISDSAFGLLVQRVSEPGGYFDTDNLISNESSYLHVIGGIRRVGATGGAYLGVGPDQNYSYIAAIRPRIAFILDIRRDNLLQHLWFKALFAQSPTRIEFLAAMTGRRPPADADRWRNRPVQEIIAYIDAAAPDPEFFDEVRRRTIELVAGYAVPLSVEDLATIARIHGIFHAAGLGLRYSSHGRAPRPSYPTYRQLLLETDRDGRRVSYLAGEDDYRFVRALHARNLIVPVTGDFAGDHALREIGEYLRERDEPVSAFYLSNVEFYLWQSRTFDRFARNVEALPAAPHAVMIRSLFGRIYGHPQTVPGYSSTQLLQSLSSFVEETRAGGYATYGDLVYKRFIDLR